MPRPGAGRGRSPFDQQRLEVTLVVEDAEAADVASLIAPEIEPAEDEAALDRRVLGQLVAVHRDRGVPLGAGLRGAAGLPERAGQPLVRMLPHSVESLIQPGHVPLLVRQVAPGTIGNVGYIGHVRSIASRNG